MRLPVLTAICLFVLTACRATPAKRMNNGRGTIQETEPVSLATVSTSANENIVTTSLGASDAGPLSDASAGWSAQAIAEAQICSDPKTTLKDHPDGGIIFNNAMTSEDAGHIDRMQQVLNALASQAGRFVCCLDVWGRNHPGEEGELMLIITLTPSGAIEDVTVDDERTTIDDQLAQACLKNVASRPDYPESPTGKTTVIEYPLRAVAGTAD